MRLAEGVTCSRIIARNGLTEITRLSITPTAKRNSYRVAILVETLPRVAGHARNPGLCNRNSYRVAAGMDLLCLGDDAHKIRPVTQPYILHKHHSQTNRETHIHHKHQPQTNHPPPHPSQVSTPKPIGNPTSITSINYKSITQPHIHHKHQPQTNHPPPHPSQASTTKPITASISAPTKRIRRLV